ncbi:MAG: mscL [Verrucomicrobiales bacterium]|nr:mscL [Verrucomicrobiales bacterium]
MGLLNDFKKFALRGNVMDLAVAVIIGAAFSKIINSLVEDILMPPIGKVLGGMDFSNLYTPISSSVPTGLALGEARKLGPVIAWGNFVTIAINFLIVAFCIFMVIRLLSRFQKKEEAKPTLPPEPSKSEVLLTEIRDLLRTR